MDHDGNDHDQEPLANSAPWGAPPNQKTSDIKSSKASQKQLSRSRPDSYYRCSFGFYHHPLSLEYPSASYKVTWKEAPSVKKLSVEERVHHKLTHGGFSKDELAKFIKANKSTSTRMFNAFLFRLLRKKEEEVTKLKEDIFELAEKVKEMQYLEDLDEDEKDEEDSEEKESPQRDFKGGWVFNDETQKMEYERYDDYDEEKDDDDSDPESLSEQQLKKRDRDNSSFGKFLKGFNDDLHQLKAKRPKLATHESSD